jgi:hypothetical protein
MRRLLLGRSWPTTRPENLRARRWSGGDDPDLLRSARQSAVKARTQAANQLQALLVTAPEGLRHRLRELPTKDLVDTCARFRPGADRPFRHRYGDHAAALLTVALKTTHSA